MEGASKVANEGDAQGAQGGDEPRRRVLVLGGGLSGLTAAYELTRTPELRARYEVTVVQLGWRLGGKLASGRNPAMSWRNEEHGLHVWFGFYDNVFALADEVLGRWRKPQGCPIRGVDDIVRPHSFASFAERDGDSWRMHRVYLPRTGHRPGHGEALPGPRAALVALIDLLRTMPNQLADLFGLDTSDRGPFLPKALSRRLWPPTDAPRRAHRRLERLAGQLVGLVEAPDVPSRARAARRIHRAARRVQRALRPLFALVPEGSRARQALYRIDLFVAGTMALCSPEHEIYVDFDLDRVAHFELRDWLAMHGAHPDSIAGCIVLAGQYDAFFQFAGGRRDAPAYEASTATRILLRGLIGYHGAVAWLLQDGMGEALIAPMYEVLLDQGVQFRFFHRVHELEVSPDAQRLAAVHLRQQAVLRGPYEPLVTYRGQRVWLSEPDWDQLVDGAELRDRGVRFESRFSPPDADLPVTLHHGKDFDEVIHALPLGAIVAPPGEASLARAWLDAHPRVRAATERINLQSSVAAQLWLDRPMEELGWRSTAAFVGWGGDYSVACDMTPVLAHEGWGPGGPSATMYLCGVVPLEAVESPTSDLAAGDRARAVAVDLLRAHLEANGHVGLAPPGEPFDWQVLHDPLGRVGAARLEAQYVRANIEPWDLCDSAVPATAGLRPEAHESGLDNMALASTWVRTGMNSTCVEGAVMSGMAAARALGVTHRPIVGEDFLARPFTHAVIASVSGVGAP